MFAITTSTPQLESLTQQLVRQWGFIFTSPATAAKAPCYLELTHNHLQLVQPGKNTPNPVLVDFLSGQVTYRRHYGGGKGETLAKAVGLSKSSNSLILDATAGLGKDAFVFASLGAKVILIERSAVAAALLEDGLVRGRREPEISAIIERMCLIHGDSLTLIPQLKTRQLPAKFSQLPDVIYLDPMFPQRNKTAQIKKDMLALQQLTGPDSDSNHLLEICLETAGKRVVVKRPIKADYLAGAKPSFSIPMKKHRFDIYLT